MDWTYVGCDTAEDGMVGFVIVAVEEIVHGIYKEPKLWGTNIVVPSNDTLNMSKLKAEQQSRLPARLYGRTLQDCQLSY